MPPTKQQAPAVGEIIAQKRAEKKLSLQELSTISGVSKGMISQIENGQVNPTLATVWKLASGLGMRLQDLFDGEPSSVETSPITKLTEENCPTLTSAKGGYQIQILSTVDMTERVELYLVKMKGTGVMDSTPHALGTVETLTVIQGEVDVQVGNGQSVHLKTLESVRYRADTRHVIRGAGKKDALFYLAVKIAIEAPR